jgi:UDPglucose 6-dehydrogenase
MRDAPSLALIRALQDGGANIRAYDPEGMEQAKTLMQGVTLYERRI